MTVSDVLRRSADLHPDRPLFVSLAPASSSSSSSSSRGGAVESSSASPPPSAVVVTYSEARAASDEHRAWIERRVEEELSSLLFAETEAAATRNATTAGDVVVAYLSGNCPDLLLSALGCTDARVRVAKRAATTERGDDFDVVGDVIDVRPALLNFRWTPSEIARAVRVHPAADPDAAADGDGDGDVASDGDRAVPGVRLTLFLYGPGFETEAREAARSIESDVEQRRRGHRARSAALPHFSSSSSVRLGGAKAKLDRSPPHRRAAAAAAASSSDDDALLLFTSGTSSSSSALSGGGGAKGVRLSHASLVVQSMAKLCPPCSYDSDTNIVASTVPFFHVGGLSSALAVVLAGGTLTFPPPPPSVGGNGAGGGDNGGAGGMKRAGFDPRAVREALTIPSSAGTYIIRPADTLVVVPAMLHSLLADDDESAAAAASASASARGTPAAPRRIYPHVRLILVGGQSLGPSQLLRTALAFPNASIVQTYACTEAASSVTFAPLVVVARGGEGKDRDAAALGRSPSTGSGERGGGPPGVVDDGNAGGSSGVVEGRRSGRGFGGGDFVGHAPAHVELAVFRREEDDDDDYDYGGGKGGTNNVTNSTAVLRRAAPGEVGVIGTRGPHVMTGYWRRGRDDGGDGSGGRGIGIGPDGWLLTGDLGYLDGDVNRQGGGGLTFCGRAADVVRTGGETVLASEVERAILSSSSTSSSTSSSSSLSSSSPSPSRNGVDRRRMLAVTECAVFALPDERLGEEVCAAVVLAGGGDDALACTGTIKLEGPLLEGVAEDATGIVRDELRRMCADAGLAGYKRPRRAFIVLMAATGGGGLPRNSSGKVLKRALMGMCARAAASSSSAAAAAGETRPRSKL
mmetsp:Transcript_30308/g.90286  ORF Transcript_30308/g.90286 Transcript_30308/m.90286 type:complete len:861 (-) Transcript_30308:36-2618(-)